MGVIALSVPSSPSYVRPPASGGLHVGERSEPTSVRLGTLDVTGRQMGHGLALLGHDGTDRSVFHSPQSTFIHSFPNKSSAYFVCSRKFVKESFTYTSTNIL